jgi:signal transduction histidine kinase
MAESRGCGDGGALPSCCEAALRWRHRALDLAQAQSRERQRLAAGLHDDIGQTLAAASLTLGQLQRLARSEATETLLDELRQLLRCAVQATRRASAELRGPLCPASELRAALEGLARQAESGAGVRVHVQVESPALPAEPAQDVLLHVARELLLNVCKHARARNAVLRLRARRGECCLAVADDGVGLPAATTWRRFDHHTGAGHGLVHASAQLRALGGGLQLRSRPGLGTVARLHVPLEVQAPQGCAAAGRAWA